MAIFVLFSGVKIHCFRLEFYSRKYRERYSTVTQRVKASEKIKKFNKWILPEFIDGVKIRWFEIGYSFLFRNNDE